jgi:hypothetical protein
VLPADLHSLESARLEVQLVHSSDNPYGTNKLGSIAADHTSYSPVTSARTDGPTLRRIGILSSTSENGPRSLNVLTAVQEDYARRLDRAYRSQFRFVFTNKNPVYLTWLTFASIGCASGQLNLALVYLTP